MSSPELPGDVFGTGLPKVDQATTVEDAEAVLRTAARAVGVDLVLQHVGSAEGESIEVSTTSATEPPSYLEGLTDWITRRGEVRWVSHGGDGVNVVQTEELLLPASALERDGKWFVSFDGRTLYGGDSILTTDCGRGRSAVSSCQWMLHVDDREFFTKVVDGGPDSQQYELGDLDPLDEITAKGLAAVLSSGSLPADVSVVRG